MTVYWIAEEVRRKLDEEYILYVKYIRMNTGEIRFIDHYRDHSSAVTPQKDTPVSAGTIKLKKGKGFFIDQHGSTTLGITPIKCLVDDDEVLARVLGISYVNEYDM